MLTVEQLMVFVRDVLGCSNVSIGAEWVRGSCPLAPWTHVGGTDRKPSFGVTLVDGRPVYNCFACGAKGPIYKLLHTLTWLTGFQDPEFLQFVLEYGLPPEEVPDATAIKFLESDDPEKKLKLAAKIVSKDFTYARRPSYSISDEILAEIPLLTAVKTTPEARKVVDWLIDERRISYDIIDLYQLRLFKGESGQLGIVFPILDFDFTVRDMWVRIIDSKRFFRLKNLTSGKAIPYPASSLWYGLPFLDADGPGPILVEGALDLLRLRSLGVPNVLASLGFPSASKVSSLTDSIITLGFDADPAGQKLADYVFNAHKNRALLIFKLDWSVAGIKDPGDLESIEQFEEVVKARTLLFDASKQRKYILERYSPFKAINDLLRAQNRKEVNIMT